MQKIWWWADKAFLLFLIIVTLFTTYYFVDELVAMDYIGIFIYSIIATAILIGSIVSILESRNPIIIIDEGKNTVNGIPIDEIQGFRKVEKNIVLIPISKKTPKIQIEIRRLEKRKELENWVYEKFENLDLKEYNEKEQRILQDKTFGKNIEDRRKRLKSATWVAKGINALAIILAIWVLFYPKPYNIVIHLVIVFPILPLLATYIFKGLIKENFDNEKNIPYPSVDKAFIAPAVLVIRTLFDFTIFDYANIWTPLFTVFISYIVVYTVVSKYNLKNWKNYLNLLAFIILYGASYSYGTCLMVNILYDSKKEVKFFNAKVIEKRISSGKNAIPHIKLAPWHTKKEAEEVMVSKQLYNSINISDSVTIYLNEGALDIPWFIVVK